MEVIGDSAESCRGRERAERGALESRSKVSDQLMLEEKLSPADVLSTVLERHAFRDQQR